jgi:hypothetical protein
MEHSVETCPYLALGREARQQVGVMGAELRRCIAVQEVLQLQKALIKPEILVRLGLLQQQSPQQHQEKRDRNGSGAAARFSSNVPGNRKCNSHHAFFMHANTAW